MQHNREIPLTDKNPSSCSYCGPEDSTAATTRTGDVTLQVKGMTCDHCVSSITKELEEIDGVENVSVNLDPHGASTVKVNTDSSVDSARLHAAVTDAGYEIVDS